MRYSLIILVLLMAIQANAQFSVGSQGMTIFAAIPVTIDGLSLTPSVSLSLANNSIQKSSTPLAGKPGINRVYQFGAPLLFSGTAGIYYLPSELNGYTESLLQLAYSPATVTPLTVTTGSNVNTTMHYVSNTLTNQTLFVVTATTLPDLTPIIYARPNTIHGTKPITVVVDVVELKGAPTSGLITVRIAKDSHTSLSFNGTATTVGGRTVQNGSWSFSDLDPSYYVLTTTSVMMSSGQLSLGLEGNLIPGSTTGFLPVSVVIDGGSGGEVRVNNNNDADRIDYFQL